MSENTGACDAPPSGDQHAERLECRAQAMRTAARRMPLKHVSEDTGACDAPLPLFGVSNCRRVSEGTGACDAPLPQSAYHIEDVSARTGARATYVNCSASVVEGTGACNAPTAGGNFILCNIQSLKQPDPPLVGHIRRT